MMDMLVWLQSTALSTWVREADTIWAYPTVITLHTFGLGVLVGASTVLDLRLLGIGRGIPLGPMRTLFPVMWIGFWINAVTGSALFIQDATREGTSLLFMTKLLFVAVGVITIVLIKRAVYNPGADPMTVGSRTKLLAIASLAAWIAAITTGRLLAYLK